MEWIRVPSAFGYSSQGQTEYGHFEYSREDGLLTGQELALGDRWIVVPFDPNNTLTPIAIHTGGRRASKTLIRTEALVLRDSGLSLYKDVNKTQIIAGQTWTTTLEKSWLCPLKQGLHEIDVETHAPGKYRLYLMSLSSFPVDIVDFTPPRPVGVTFPLKTLFEIHCLQPYKLKVCFHIVEDASAKRSKLTESGVEVMVKRARSVLNQAVVTPVATSVQKLPISESLGDPVSHTQGKKTIFQLLDRYKNTSADVNVFSIWAYKPSAGNPHMAADPGRRLALIADTAKHAAVEFTQALAQIAGLNIPNLFGTSDHLNLAQVLQINGFAAKLA